TDPGRHPASVCLKRRPATKVCGRAVADGTVGEWRSYCAAVGNGLGIYSHSNEFQNLVQPAVRETSVRDHRGMDCTARRCCLATRAAAYGNSQTAHDRA